MRSARTLLVAVLCLSFAGSVSAQNFEYIGSILWTGINDIHIQGDYAYCAFQNGLVIVDISDNSEPEFVSRLPLSNRCESITVWGDYAYAVCDSPALQIIDISDPSDPVQVGILEIEITETRIFYENGYVYIPTGSHVSLIDVSDPSNPFFVSSRGVSSSVEDIFVVDGLAYVAANAAGFVILDFTDPENPVRLGDIDIGYGAAVAVAGTLAYVAASADGLKIIGVSDPSDPILLGTYDLENRSARNVLAIDNLVYVCFGYERIHILEVNEPARPEMIGIYDVDGSSSEIFLDGDNLFVSTSDDFRILDVSDPTRPRFQGIYDVPYLTMDCVVDGNYAYLAEPDGLIIVDISQPWNPIVITNFELPERELWNYSAELVMSAPYIFIRGSDGINRNIVAVDVSDVYNPVILGQIEYLQFSQNHISLCGNYIYTNIKEEGIAYLKLLDITDPSDPSFVSEVPLPDTYVRDIFAYDDYAYVANDDSGLVIIDATDPLDPTISYVFSSAGAASRVAVSGNYAFALTTNGGLQVLDVSNPENPEVVGSYELDQWPTSISIYGDYAHIGYGSWPNSILDISDVSNIQIAQTYHTPGNSYCIQQVGDVLFIADHTSFLIFGFGLTDIDDKYIDGRPTDITFPVNYPNPFNASTTIEYNLPVSSMVVIEIYDILGRKIDRLNPGIREPGYNKTAWDAHGVSSGVYFYKIIADGYTQKEKMLLLK